MFKHMVSEKGNERRGFVEEPQYRKLVEVTAGQLWMRGLLALGYTFGFRKAETKNGEGRTVTLTNECRGLVMELRRGKQLDDFLFTRKNEPIRDFRGARDVLIKAAGVTGLLFHDLRRSAVRNMVAPRRSAEHGPVNFGAQDGFRVLTVQYRLRG